VVGHHQMPDQQTPLCQTILVEHQVADLSIHLLEKLLLTCNCNLYILVTCICNVYLQRVFVISTCNVYLQRVLVTCA
jgi:hypothetical protein